MKWVFVTDSGDITYNWTHLNSIFSQNEQWNWWFYNHISLVFRGTKVCTEVVTLVQDTDVVIDGLFWVFHARVWVLNLFFFSLDLQLEIRLLRNWVRGRRSLVMAMLLLLLMGWWCCESYDDARSGPRGPGRLQLTYEPSERVISICPPTRKSWVRITAGSTACRSCVLQSLPEWMYPSWRVFLA